MKTWDEVKKVTLSKLFMDESEADEQGYLGYFVYFANECLNLIANGVKPKYVAFEIEVFDNRLVENKDYIVYTNEVGSQSIIEADLHTIYRTSTTDYIIDDGGLVVYTGSSEGFEIVEGSNFVYDVSPCPTSTLRKQSTLIKYLDEQGIKRWTLANEETIYKVSNDEQYVLKNGELVLDNDAEFETVVEGSNFTFGYVTDSLITLPDNFISFADMVEYLDGDPGEYNIYFGRDKMKLKKPGHYIIYYNALYDEIPEDTTNQSGENSTPIYIDADQSVINCLPSYIASQVLAQDDTIRSTVLKNEFELLLSRLDTDVMYETKHYKSTGGWY